MKNLLLGGAIALSLAATTAVAGGVSGGNANSNWTIYGWQNWSIENVDVDAAREYMRINNNAANIGFAASIDTGVGGMKANLQCEQFTFHNRFNDFTNWCNRNSKMSLSGDFGEIMVGQWLLPYNEMVAQWVDPFYDAGADSHTSIMGNMGNNEGGFYNGSGFGSDEAFNRRQEEIIQYFSPNVGGLSFRVATTNFHRNSGLGPYITGGEQQQSYGELDPRIWSTGVSYDSTLASGDSVWFALTYEKHDEWAAVKHDCSDSDDEGYRIAGRYIHNMANGGFIQVSAMYENLEYQWDECVSNTSGFDSYADVSGNLDLERDAYMISTKIGMGNGMDIRASYMYGEEIESFGSDIDDSDASAYNLGVFYTMPAGTELRLTYSKVDNEDASHYDFGIGGTGVGAGEDVEMYAIGLVQWF
tara:strand:- start:2954 stop:4201 length:1248 start_codon:yes stop_codon:yes gene_type:complete